MNTEAQGEVVVTWDRSGAIVAVTRQDAEGRILSVLAEAQDGGEVVNGIELSEAIRLGRRYAMEIDKRGMPRAAQVFEALAIRAERTAPQSAPVGVEAKRSREAFEAYIAKGNGDLSTFGSGRDTYYSNSAVNNAWDGWQAGTRWALAQQPAAVDDQPDCPHSALDGCDCYAAQQGASHDQ